MATPSSDASYYDLRKAQDELMNNATKRTNEFIERYEEMYYISVGNREERKEMEDFIFMKRMEGTKFMEKEVMKRAMEAIQLIEANVPKKKKVAYDIYKEARSDAKRQIIEEINKPEVQAWLDEYEEEEIKKPQVQACLDESDEDIDDDEITNILGWAIMVAIGFNAAISVRVWNEVGGQVFCFSIGLLLRFPLSLSSSTTNILPYSQTLNSSLC